MKKLIPLVVIFLFVCAAKNLKAQLYQEGFFLGGGLTILYMSGGGNYNNLGFDVTKDLIPMNENDDIGWSWENKFLFGVRPVIGYKFSPSLAVLASYKYYFEKEGTQASENAMGAFSGSNYNINSNMQYNQSSIQLLGQFYPFADNGFYLLGGIERIAMSADLYGEISFTDDFMGYSATSEYKYDGDDSVIGFLLGAGFETPLFNDNIFLSAAASYSFANYKGSDLLKSEDNLTEGELVSSELDFNVGGLNADLDLRVYLTGKSSGQIITPEMQQPKESETVTPIEIILTGGISSLTGDGSEYLKLGYTLGVNVFLGSNKNISFGGRLAYNYLPPDGEEIMKLASSFSDYDYTLESTSGNMSIIEIVPSVKFALANYDDQSTLFEAQLGLGLYSISSSISAKGTSESPSHYSEMTITPKFASETKFGIQAGASIVIGKHIALSPMYNLIFVEEETQSYFTFNLGYIINN